MLRFGVFELDEAAGELRRNGSLVRLPPQPFEVLRILAHNSGQVVDRDRLRREIWGETSVDFDRSLNVCVAQIRTALNDDAESPRFIQTVPRRGYRFVAPVEGGEAAAVTPAALPASRFPVRRIAVAGALLLAATAAGYRFAGMGARSVRLAVLPFDGIGAAATESAQIDGLFDELLTRLGGVEPDRLRVIGRRSVAIFRGEHKPLREIGALLSAPYAIEATVRPESGGLRVAVRLAQTATETVLWSDSFVQQGADPAMFEEDVVARVSAAVLARLFPEAPPPAAREAACRDGWDAYRSGRLLANSGTVAGLEKSIAWFEQAPCAPARAALADTLIRLARMGPRREGLWERARAAAANVPGAELAVANVAFWRDWDWKAAERAFQAALRARPSDPDAHHDYAWLLIALGRRSAGLAALQRAIALDPLSARINMDAGWLLLQAGRFREAAAQARRALELDPHMNEARACLARALVYAGEDAAALDVMRQTGAAIPSVLPPREAVRAVWRAERIQDPYQRACRLAWLGSTAEALAELESARQSRNAMMPMVAADPAFQPLHSDPRFRTIVHDLGL